MFLVSPCDLKCLKHNGDAFKFSIPLETQSFAHNKPMDSLKGRTGTVRGQLGIGEEGGKGKDREADETRVEKGTLASPSCTTHQQM